MSFPYHDRNWNEVADFLEPRLHAGDRILAPDRLWWRLAVPVERWVGPNLDPGRSYDWVVAHKGELPQFGAFLEALSSMVPVFANEVFVIWHAGTRARSPSSTKAIPTSSPSTRSSPTCRPFRSSRTATNRTPSSAINAASPASPT